MVSIEGYNRAATSPLDAAQLEGDFLLRWGDQENAKAAIRYCHFTSPEEAVGLIESFPVTIVETFRADGREGRLNSYLIARRS